MLPGSSSAPVLATCMRLENSGFGGYTETSICMVQGLWFMGHGLRSILYGSRLTVSIPRGVECFRGRAQHQRQRPALGFNIQGLGFRIFQHLVVMIWGLFNIWGPRFRILVWILRFMRIQSRRVHRGSSSAPAPATCMRLENSGFGGYTETSMCMVQGLLFTVYGLWVMDYDLCCMVQG